MSPEKIYDAPTTSVMKVQGQALSEPQKRILAEAVSARDFGSLESGAVSLMPDQCASNPPLSEPSAAPAWNGWRVDPANARFQTPQKGRSHAKASPVSEAEVGFRVSGERSGLWPGHGGFGAHFVGSHNGYVYR
jgi:hypothetical protein